tara:strand:+ start:2522 stop:2632 length:111 start_codon:yes stop_codon:yes gene_type:complete
MSKFDKFMTKIEDGPFVPALMIAIIIGIIATMIILD